MSDGTPFNGGWFDLDPEPPYYTYTLLTIDCSITDTTFETTQYQIATIGMSCMTDTDPQPVPVTLTYGLSGTDLGVAPPLVQDQPVRLVLWQTWFGLFDTLEAEPRLVVGGLTSRSASIDPYPPETTLEDVWGPALQVSLEDGGCPEFPDGYACGVWLPQAVTASVSGESIHLLEAHVGEVGGYRFFISQARIHGPLEPECRDIGASDIAILVEAVP